MIKWNSVAQTMREETMGDHWKRLRNGGARKPLRSIRELAEELGVKPKSLAAIMAKNNGPKGRYRTGTGATGGKNTWYDPEEVRAWWKQHQQEKNQ